MKLRELTIAVACFIAVMIGHEVYAQEATASATNVQSQGSVGTMTATTTAQQAQQQGQTAISGGGSVSNSGNSAVKFNNSFNGAQPIRYLPVPAALPIENYQPAIFGRADYADKGPDFVSMRQLVHAMNLVEIGEVDVEGAKQIRITAQMMRKKKETKQPKDAKPSKPLPVKFEINDGEAVNNGFVPIATLTVETKKPDKSNSASLAIAIGKKAQELGATNVVFLTEGSSKQLQSSGWGIGFSYNYAQVNSDPSGNGSVGSGGFGYSQGKAGYRNLIYLTAIVGVRKDG